jgi:A/G-specific adenine glycosylase
VALGAAVTAGLAAFALIPTKELRVVKPSKPMFFYITQLLQAQVGIKDTQC